MAYTYRNLAYDLTLFEEPYYEGTSARSRAKAEKDATEEERPEKLKKGKIGRSRKGASKAVEKIRRRKSNFGRIALGVVVGVAVMFTVASIIHGQVQLNEINQQIIDAKSELSEMQSVYTQLEMKVDSSISTSVVEEYAKDKLEMNKASNSQKEFISLSTGDKAEVSGAADKNVFEAIADAVTSLWS